MRTLVVGGGQLGSALREALGPEGVVVSRGIPWSDLPATPAHVRAVTSAFVNSCGDEPWLVCWSAGRGVVGTPDHVLRHERVALGALLDGLASADLHRSAGSLFVASSAGGIYTEGGGEQCTELTPPSPTSDYGRSKLLQDELVQAWSEQHRIRTMIGRISNLYGPKQDVRKPQGFISHLCRAMAHRTLFTLAVPVSTIRDFVYTDDVAQRVARWATMPGSGAPSAQIKLMVAGRSVTLGHVIAMTKAITRTPPRVLLADRPGADEQPASLRFRSVALQHLDDAVPARPLEEGIRNTWAATMRGLQVGA